MSQTAEKPHVFKSFFLLEIASTPLRPEEWGGKGGGSLTNELQALMEGCPNAESLNAEVIMPFVQALVTVCDARGYIFNIYGDHCNLTITPEDHAEPLYRLIDSYLDEAGLG